MTEPAEKRVEQWHRDATDEIAADVVQQLAAQGIHIAHNGHDRWPKIIAKHAPGESEAVKMLRHERDDYKRMYLDSVESWGRMAAANKELREQLESERHANVEVQEIIRKYQKDTETLREALQAAVNYIGCTQEYKIGYIGVRKIIDQGREALSRTEPAKEQQPNG